MQYSFSVLSAATVALFASQAAAAAYRSDARCGKNFGGALCNPKGEFGGCCSHAGWCGSTPAYCLPSNNCQSGCKGTTSSSSSSSSAVKSTSTSTKAAATPTTTSSIKVSTTIAVVVSSTPPAFKTSSTTSSAVKISTPASSSIKTSAPVSSATKATSSASATATASGPNDHFVVSSLQAYDLPAGMGPSGPFASYCGISFNLLNAKTGGTTACSGNYFPDSNPHPTGDWTCDDDSFIFSLASVTACSEFALKLTSNVMSTTGGIKYVGTTSVWNSQSDRTASPWTNAVGIHSVTYKSNVDINADFTYSGPA